MVYPELRNSTGLITEVEALLNQLTEAGFRMEPELVAVAKRLADEK